MPNASDRDGIFAMSVMIRGKVAAVKFVKP